MTFEGNFCDIAQCREIPCPYNGACSQRKVWEWLKAYEDTGLTPEDCARATEIDDILLDEYYPIGRMRELIKADKDGRLVVLPCKVGDKLYRVFDGNISEHEVQNMKYFARQRRLGIDITPFFPDAEKFIGKTVFLTREEAEKALEAMKDG
jgi:hypothetical protein